MAGFDPHNYCVRCPDKSKGPDPRVEKLESSNCNFCSILTPDQRCQLSTQSYKLKKANRDSKKTDETATPSKEPKDTLSPSLVDLALVSVVVGVDGQGTAKSPDLSAPAEKRKKVEKKKASTSKSVMSTDKPAKSTTENRPAKASTDARIDKLDQKWSTSSRLSRWQLLTLHQPAQSRLRPLHQAGQPTSSPVYQSTNCFRFAWNQPSCYKATVYQQISH